MVEFFSIMAKKRKTSEALAAAQCYGKHRYDSAVLAFAVAKQQRRRKDSRVDVYRCQTCSGWHIGNKKPKSYRKEHEE